MRPRILSSQFYLQLIVDALILAGVAAAVSITFADHGDIAPHLFLTALVTATAACLMLPASTMASRTETHLAGNLAIAVITADFIVLLLAIWSISAVSTSGNWPMWQTAIAIFLTGLPAILLLRVTGKPYTALAVPVGTILCGLSLSLFLVAIWFEQRYHTDGFPITRSAWSFYLLMFPAIGSLVGFDPRRRWLLWRPLGAASALAAFGFTFSRDFGFFHGPGAPFIFFTMLSLLIAHANLSMLAPLRRSQYWLRYTAIIAVGATGFFAVLSAVYPYPQHHIATTFERLCGASGVLACCGTIAIAVAARIQTQPSPR